MVTSVFSPRIGIYGSDETVSAPSRGCYLWPLGYIAAVSEAGGTPVSLAMPRQRSLREEILADYPYLEADDIAAVLEFAAKQNDHPVLRSA